MNLKKLLSLVWITKPELNIKTVADEDILDKIIINFELNKESLEYGVITKLDYDDLLLFYRINRKKELAEILYIWLSEHHELRKTSYFRLNDFFNIEITATKDISDEEKLCLISGEKVFLSIEESTSHNEFKNMLLAHARKESLVESLSKKDKKEKALKI